METEKKQSNEAGDSREQKRKSAWDIRPYLAMGLTAILVVVICIAIFFLVYRFQGLSDGIGKVLRSLQSILIGFIVAYLLNPIMKAFEGIFGKHLYKGKEKTFRQKRTIRGLSVACAMAVFFAIITVLILLIVPELVKSVEDLIFTMNGSTDLRNRIAHWPYNLTTLLPTALIILWTGFRKIS
jgi:predicted PurR-regulated permease PerM